MRSKGFFLYLAWFVILGLEAGLLSCAGPQHQKESFEATPPEFRPAIGQWKRKAGGMVLTIEKIQANGTMTASYLNDNRSTFEKYVNIAQATARIEDGKLTLFVKLSDTRYPGSYYNLTYDAKTDTLKGTYYHAEDRVTASHTFSRYSP